tara:strand:- start:216 stop:404 length:189 start_codon:yes stop_codon:yes gene_type:complete
MEIVRYSGIGKEYLCNPKNIPKTIQTNHRSDQQLKEHGHYNQFWKDYIGQEAPKLNSAERSI